LDLEIAAEPNQGIHLFEYTQYSLLRFLYRYYTVHFVLGTSALDVRRRRTLYEQGAGMMNCGEWPGRAMEEWRWIKMWPGTAGRLYALSSMVVGLVVRVMIKKHAADSMKGMASSRWRDVWHVTSARVRRLSIMEEATQE